VTHDPRPTPRTELERRLLELSGAAGAVTPAVRHAGPHELHEVLGEGGMSTVYRGLDPRGRPVAVKVLPASVEDDDDTRRFDRERLARVEHPNVISILDSGVLPGGARWLAMELLEGEDLASRIARARLSPAAAVEIAIQIADALEAVHAAGLVHRDVKPANVFLCRGGGVKLLDFGIALRPTTDTRLTRKGYLVGTPAYLAPEQAEGGTDVDARADLWALGAVLYHCQAGRPPFERETALATVLAAITEAHVPLAQAAPGTPIDLSLAVDRALEKKPEARWQSARELCAALRAADLSPGSDLGSDALPVRELRVLTIVLLEGIADAPRVERVVREEGGRHLPVFGGRVVAVFGAKQTEGDEASRAVRVASLLRPYVALAAVATGRAGLGRGAVAGDVVGRAERGVALGRPGVVVDEPTSRAALGWEFAALGDGLYQASKAPDSSRTATPGHAAPLFGREGEMAQLRGAALRAIEGRATLVLCVGPPGIGKSRLLREAQAIVSASAPCVVSGRAEPRGGLPVLAEAIAVLGGWEPSASNEVRRGMLRRLAEERLGAGDRARACAESLGEALGTLFPDSPSLLAARSDPQIMMDRIRVALADWVEAATTAGPTAILIDDLQWADRLTVEVLDDLLDVLADRPLLVVAACRSDLLDSRPDLFAGRGAVRIEPSPLGPSDVVRLAAAVVGADAVVPESLLRVLADRTAGNPFFVEQIVLQARDTGADPESLPLTVEAAVQARLDHLPPAEKETCKRASVLGRIFWQEALSELGDPDPQASLASLRRKDLVGSRARSRLAGAREWQFRSALVQEVAYRMLPEPMRVDLHRRAGEFLGGRQDVPDEDVAIHLDRGGDRDGAASRFARAALAAATRGDDEAVLRCSDRALQLDAGAFAFALHVARAEAYRHGGDAFAEGRSLQNALAVAEGNADADRGKALVARSALEARTGRLDQAIETAREAVRAASDGEALAIARANEAVTLALAGRRAEADEAIAEADRALAGAGALTRARVAGWRASVYSLAGDLGASRDAFEAALQACREAGDLRRMGLAEASLADCYARAGMLEESERALSAALEATLRVRNRKTERYVRANLGRVRVALGRIDEGTESLHVAQSLASAAGDGRLLVAIDLYRAIALIAAGDAQAASALAQRAAAGAIESGQRGWAARAFAADARARLALGEVDVALDLSGRALSLRDEAGGVEEDEAEVFAARVAVLRKAGRTAEADAIGKRGRERVREMALRIGDPAWRERFSILPAAHRELSSG